MNLGQFCVGIGVIILSSIVLSSCTRSTDISSDPRFSSGTQSDMIVSSSGGQDERVDPGQGLPDSRLTISSGSMTEEEMKESLRDLSKGE